MQEASVRVLGWEGPLEKGQATHSRVLGLPWWLRWERICLQCGRLGFDPWVGKIPWRRKWLPTPGFLPGESHEQRSLEGYGPGGCKESGTTERLSTHIRETQVGVGRVLWSLSSSWSGDGFMSINHFTAIHRAVRFWVVPSSVCALCLQQNCLFKKLSDWEFPGGPMVKNLPSNAGDMGSIPGWEITRSRDAGQLRWCATNSEPALSGVCLPQLQRRLCAAMKNPACCN